MDGILALGHFCETHGPCVILCTQRCKNEPKEISHNFNAPVCETCQSLDLQQAIVSRDKLTCYVTTRNALQDELGCLLRQAIVRSLSCEETSRDGGTLYFGDNERGHVISHIFTVQDSLARGFKRKYCILILMRDRIHLLNNWPFLTKHIKQIAVDLEDKSIKINNSEQMQKSQRAVRQAQNTPNVNGRSLSQLTGEPAVFAHIHLWFTWLLSVEPIIEKPFTAPELPVDCQNCKLRQIHSKMTQNVFRTICYCYLIGIRVESEDPEIDLVFKEILPRKFILPRTGDCCNVYMTIDGNYGVCWRGTLPQKLPTLLLLIECALNDPNMPDSVLAPHINSLVMQWFNIAFVVCWMPNSHNVELLKSLGVQKHDMPLLSYWVPQCKEL